MKTIDWERVEIDYRAGMHSLRELSAMHGVSHVSISKKAKAMGWERDLAPKIKAKADALVNKALVNSLPNAAKAVSERETVDLVGARHARIRVQQQADIARCRSLCSRLWDELESQSGNLPGLQDLGEMLRHPDENGADRLNDVYRAVISLPERSKTMKALTETLKHLIAMENETNGIAAVAQQIDVTLKRPAKEMTDDELAAIAAGGSAGTSHSA